MVGVGVGGRGEEGGGHGHMEMEVGGTPEVSDKKKEKITVTDGCD